MAPHRQPRDRTASPGSVRTDLERLAGEVGSEISNCQDVDSQSKIAISCASLACQESAMFKNLFDLTGRRILVTGSNGGIGNSLALGLAQHGATVILNGRRPDKLHAATEHLRRQGLSAEEARFDVTNEEEVLNGVALLDTTGGVDVLVNNAGIQRRISLEKVDLDTWNEVLQTNLKERMVLVAEVSKRMIERKAGKIINICSLMSDLGRITTGPYTAAKGGLKMF